MRLDDKDTEVDISAIEGAKIAPGEQFRFNACGRSDTSSGTEGIFEVYEDGSGGKKVRHFYWDCPWGSKKNTWTVSGTLANRSTCIPF